MAEIKPINFFAVNEILTAYKLNQALELLNANTIALKNEIEKFCTEEQIDSKIAEAATGYLHLDNPATETGGSQYAEVEITGHIKFMQTLWANEFSAQTIRTTGGKLVEFPKSNAVVLNGDSVYLSNLHGSNQTDSPTPDAKISVHSNVVVQTDREIYKRTETEDDRYLTRSEVDERIRIARDVQDWSAERTYEQGDECIHDKTTRLWYYSLKDNNLNHPPSNSPEWWREKVINLDGYYTKEHIDANFVPASALDPYVGGKVYSPDLTEITEGQVIVFPFSYVHGENGLIVTVGGVIQTIDKDYEEIAPTPEQNGMSDSVRFLKPYDLTLTGALEFRVLPHGHIISDLGIDDGIVSPMTTFSSAKLTSIHNKLLSYMQSNVSLGSSEWIITKQVGFAKTEQKGYRRANGWVDLALLRLKPEDVFLSPEATVDFYPAKKIDFITNDGRYEGYVYDANTTRINMYLVGNHDLTGANIVIDRGNSAAQFNTDSPTTVYQIVVYRVKNVNNLNLNDDGTADFVDWVIDDANTLADKTWSSKKTSQEIAESERVAQEAKDYVLQKESVFNGGIRDLRNFVTQQSNAAMQDARGYADAKVGELRTEFEGLLDERENDYITASDDVAFSGVVSFDNNVTAARQPLLGDHLANKRYVDETLRANLGNVQIDTTNLAKTNVKNIFSAPQQFDGQVTFHSPQVIFQNKIRGGYGSGTLMFTPEDNSTKTLRFSDASLGANNRFTIDLENKVDMINVKAPTQNHHPATKAYVDERTRPLTTGDWYDIVPWNREETIPTGEITYTGFDNALHKPNNSAFEVVLRLWLKENDSTVADSHDKVVSVPFVFNTAQLNAAKWWISPVFEVCGKDMQIPTDPGTSPKVMIGVGAWKKSGAIFIRHANLPPLFGYCVQIRKI